MNQTLRPWPPLRQGDKDHPVTTLQHLLRARGHPVAPDGSFGPRTDTAVRAFQREKHLAEDGVVGQQTWRALIVALRRGDTGDAVRGLQAEFQFRTLSGPVGAPPVDGDFGPGTETALQDFQKGVRALAPAMAVDGVAGPLTWQALVSGMVSF